MMKSVKPALIKYVGGKWEYALAINEGEILISSRGNRIQGQLEDVKIMDMAGNSIDNFNVLQAICDHFNDTGMHQASMFEGTGWDAPSPAQKKFAEDLLKTHKIANRSTRTKAEVEDIIATFKDRITPNQSVKITDIEESLGVQFTGTTKEEATAFIDRYKSIHTVLKNNPHLDVKILGAEKLIKKPKTAYALVRRDVVDGVPIAIGSTLDLTIRYVNSLPIEYLKDKMIIKLPYTDYSTLELAFKGKMITEDKEFGAFYLA